MKASPGDTVYVAGEPYSGSGDEVVQLYKNISLSGGWDTSFSNQAGSSIIDGEGSRRGITVSGGITALVDHFVIQNGRAIDGGGIINYGILTVWDSTIRNNSATGDVNSEGGGVEVGSDGTLILFNSTVSGNTAQSGGGIFSAWGNVILDNSTISGNSAGGGGGINNLGGDLEISSSTISNNSISTLGGGGIHNEADGRVEMRNSIIAGNMGDHGPDCDGIIISAGYNLIGDSSACILVASSGDITNVDPLLGILKDNGGRTFTHALSIGSWPITKGNPAGCRDYNGDLLDTDQRFLPRVGTCDIGAFEYQGEVRNNFLPFILTP